MMLAVVSVTSNRNRTSFRLVAAGLAPFKEWILNGLPLGGFAFFSSTKIANRLPSLRSLSEGEGTPELSP
jgi:hypothetical protein